MLHLAGRIPLGVDVGDLLQLQRAFQRDRIVNAAPEEEEILRFVVAMRQILDLPLLLQDGLELVGQHAHLVHGVSEILAIFSAQLPDVQRQ